MSINLHVLSSSQAIKPFLKDIKSVVGVAEKAINKLTAIGEVDVVVYVNPEGTIREIGIGGYTPTENIVFISLDPKNSKFKKSFKDELLYTLIHEINHAIRFRTPIKKESLFEAIISEGLADHFAMEATGRKSPPPWCVALTEKQKGECIKKASKVWHLATYDHPAWFYGSDKKVPRWAGYTLGYDLAASYLAKHPKALPSKLISAKASIFL